MAISEETRHQLYRRLEEVLGPGEATTLMEHLPPVGWADVATRRDLDALEARVNARIDAVETRIDTRIEILETHLDARLARQEASFERALRAMTWRLVTVIVAAVGSLVAAGIRF